MVDHRLGDRDLILRIAKARAGLTMLRNVWASRVICRATKLRIFNSNVKAHLLYSSETWR